MGIEIPGLLLLSRFDSTVVEGLGRVRRDLVTLSYSFDRLSQLRSTVTTNRETLRSAQVEELVDDFISSCERMKNLDKSFWSLLVTEVTSMINSFSEQSKHPFPKLIDIVSLAGLSFLLAQLLRFLG